MKKIVTILFIIMLFITIFQIRDTYALYKAKIEGDYQSLLGIWSVKVNNTDLSSGNADMTFEITGDYLHFEENEYVDGNYIAPGTEGYFDLLIDATEADVSVKYNIQMAAAATVKVGEDLYELTNIIPFEVTGVEDVFIKDEEIDTTAEHINNIDMVNKTATGVIPLSVSEAGYCGRVRVKFRWINDDDNSEIDTMFGNDAMGTEFGYTTGSNEIDVALVNSSAQPSIYIPVSVEVVQYMGEEITTPVATP